MYDILDVIVKPHCVHAHKSRVPCIENISESKHIDLIYMLMSTVYSCFFYIATYIMYMHTKAECHVLKVYQKVSILILYVNVYSVFMFLLYSYVHSVQAFKAGLNTMLG